MYLFPALGLQERAAPLQPRGRGRRERWFIKWAGPESQIIFAGHDEPRSAAANALRGRWQRRGHTEGPGGTGPPGASSAAGWEMTAANVITAGRRVGAGARDSGQ